MDLKRKTYFKWKIVGKYLYQNRDEFSVLLFLLTFNQGIRTPFNIKLQRKEERSKKSFKEKSWAATVLSFLWNCFGYVKILVSF